MKIKQVTIKRTIPGSDGNVTEMKAVVEFGDRDCPLDVITEVGNILFLSYDKMEK